MLKRAAKEIVLPMGTPTWHCPDEGTYISAILKVIILHPSSHANM